MDLSASLAQSGRIGAEPLHELRIELRRLEAWLNLTGDRNSAKLLNGKVSLLSPLRSLHALERWLTRQKAPPADLTIVRQEIRRNAKKLIDDRIFASIDETVKDINSLNKSLDRFGLRRTWRSHRKRLARHLTGLGKKPKRKQLHRLRLDLKQLRYQLEWTAPRAKWQSGFIANLKQAQRCLGAYEELAAFRRLATEMKLAARPSILKRWRQTRKRARQFSREMTWLLQSLDHLDAETKRAGKRETLDS